MFISNLDWIIIIAVLLISLVIGLFSMKRAGKNPNEYFAGGKNMPWWLLGISMVATTFSTDTPNLVTDIVRKHGVSGNWVWFAFLLTGMFTVYIYAKLWKRSGVLTDIEFYELRYSGKSAAFLRGFRSIYLGVIFNILVMATVTLAAIKIGNILFGLSSVETVLFTGTIIVVYSSLGGLRGVLLTDFFQFFLAMSGSIYLMFHSINKAGGMEKIIGNKMVINKLSLLPDFNNTETLVALFVLPLAVQWWAVWYSGFEPGGGGYIAQRMFAAKDEKNALNATLLFNISNFALRPWPWIITALASLVIFPDLASLSSTFPHLDPGLIGNDMAYPAMITFLPPGIMGLVLASLIAAYMSTISTHLNWGSSYIVNDFYKRFVDNKAGDKQLVFIGRISTVALMIVSSFIALFLENALQAFNILLQIGAGTGLIFLLRWFWWRINAISELTAMISALTVTIYFEFIHTNIGFADPPNWIKLLSAVIITTIAWITATLISKPADHETLLKFYNKIRPGGKGWNGFLKIMDNRGIKVTEYKKNKGEFTSKLMNIFLGTFSIYSFLFLIGFWIEGEEVYLGITAVVFVFSTLMIVKRHRSDKLNIGNN